MATTQTLITNGFAVPTGTDAITNGDEAIAQNANAAYELNSATRQLLADTKAVLLAEDQKWYGQEVTDRKAGDDAEAKARSDADNALDTRVTANADRLTETRQLLADTKTMLLAEDQKWYGQEVTDRKSADDSIRADMAAQKWHKAPLTNPDLNTITTPGLYPIIGASGGSNFPVVATGSLEVTGADAYLLQLFKSWKSGGLQQYSRRRVSGTWQPWEPVRWLHGNVTSGTDLNTLTTDGIYLVLTTVTNNPDGQLGTLETTLNGLQQRYFGRNGKTYTRTYAGGVWSAWDALAFAKDVTALADRVATLESGTANTTSAAADNPRRAGHAVRLSRATQLIGKRTSTRAQVAIIFDHGSIAFRDIVFPKLQELGLTATLAVNAGRLDPSYAYAAKEIQDWTPLKSWYDAGIEIANHGRTHQDWDTPQGVYDEIVTGMDELETAMARPIHSWVQPGAIGNKGGYMGFTNGNSYAKYWGTEAGALIMENHAFVTGTVYPTDRHYRLQGEPIIGAHGFWLDGGATQLDAAKTAVTDAEARKTGILLRGHPQSIDASTSNTTTAELHDFLTWVAAERDAGRIDVVTFAQWNLTEITN